MKVMGIIAEYNPIHNGHIYHLNTAKKLTKSDLSVIVMSGSFTQSGNIAIYDKFTRAKLAVKAGADLVIELPTIYANSSANYFAFGAINILENLKIVDSICFGSECDDILKLKNISNILVKNEDIIWKKISINLKNGTSFANVRQDALQEFIEKEDFNILSSSNNILAIEYLKNLEKLNSNIEPFCIKRISSNYNEILLNKNENNFTSATSIRNSIKFNKQDLIKKYIPDFTENIINNDLPLFNDDLFNLIKYKIITTETFDLKNISEVTEGLENKLIKEINNSKNYDEFVFNIKSKRYQLTKIKRMLINILLDIKKTDLDNAIKNRINYAHILACSKKGKMLLSKISKNSDIDLITSINNNTFDTIKDENNKYLKLDILASNIYSSIKNDNIQKDYTNKL